MKFDLNKKIEEIRQKPEHIRMRYIWGMVSACMMLIIFIWVISVRENFRSVDIDIEGLPQIKDDFKALREELPSGESIKSALDQSLIENEEGLQEGQ